jgi:exodeoxyribonuclease-3
LNKSSFKINIIPRALFNDLVIICGDVNIVHQERDIKNWKANQKNSGCLPQERAWLDELFFEVGFIDGFREVNPLAQKCHF